MAGETSRTTLGRRRLAPLGALVALGAGLWLVFGDRLSFETLEAHRSGLIAWRDAHYVLALLAFVALYAAATAVSIPGAIWLSITGGFLFGVWAGAALAVIGATLGATIIFLAVKAGFGDWLRRRAEGWLQRFETGVRDNEVGFMLAIRLVPLVPFWVSNLAPALLGVATRTFVWTTFVGIIPATLVYASVGAGLGEVLARGERPDLGAIFDWKVLGPLLGLAALALLPALWRVVRRRRDGEA